MNDKIAWGECWHDTLLERITIDYDNIVVEIEVNEKITKLICYNFIGFDYLGQWDENVIKCITLSEDDEMIFVAKERIKYNNSLGGGVKIFETQWKCVCIELIDGVVIHIICEKVDYNN